ncbi:right-handed parallel beta-helix repeat-containing protein [Mucilaginibacter limnophilus]|uniref:Right-handed parallel beta-helix repeat-containing protein n=1 Tax=Mucilaginibacter limnophilus TaxID=1932778 RepID=A0A437MSS3_9SPHI|nr:right-handed parallel beta-helix repeat-containing protein [Mucilaginibacter limnophilus]RVU00715.1 right-handed parallel beta-helix repeat-containing protein [Mucilaginibacter limnophilus]
MKVKLFILTLYVLASLNACAQNGFFYKPIPSQFLQIKESAAVQTRFKNLKQQAYDATRALPQGYKTDGTVDYTRYMQLAFNAHDVVLMPNFPVMVNDSGLTVNNGQTILFDSLSTLLLKPSNLETYEILRVHQVQNVEIYRPVIYGDKYTHLGAAGQWGMGIAVRASKNVNIVSPHIYKCWGDGIYVGQINKIPAQGITITDPLLDDNRRNGMSITAGNGVTVTGGIVANSNGQMPMSGIDIEPNHTTDVIDNITLTNLTTMNNRKYGIVVSLQHLLKRTVGKTAIRITNARDEESGVGFGIIGRPSTDTINGAIYVLNPVWIENKEVALRYPVRNFGMYVLFKNPVIQRRTAAYELKRLRQQAEADPKIVVE